MRIFYGTVEIAGQSATMAQGMRDRWHDAVSVNYMPSYMGDQCDYSMNNPGEQEMNLFADWMVGRFDVFHFRFGSALTPRLECHKYLKATDGKYIVHQFHGSEVRRVSLAKKISHWSRVKVEDETLIERMLRGISSFTQHCIIEDDELLPHVKDYFEHIHYLPLALDLSQFPYESARIPDGKPLVVHAPTNADVKGTDYIIKVMEKLADKCNFGIIQGQTRKRTIEAMGQADIVVDQVCIGSHGLLALESMALGKPVVCHIADAVTYPDDLPIIKANPETLESVLTDLIDNREQIPVIGEKGRRYVVKHHDVDTVAGQAERIYEAVVHG